MEDNNNNIPISNTEEEPTNPQQLNEENKELSINQEEIITNQDISEPQENHEQQEISEQQINAEPQDDNNQPNPEQNENAQSNAEQQMNAEPQENIEQNVNEENTNQTPNEEPQENNETPTNEESQENNETPSNEEPQENNETPSNEEPKEETKPTHEGAIDEIVEDMQSALLSTGQNDSQKTASEIQSPVNSDEVAKEYVYDTDHISLPGSSDLHQPFFLNHITSVELLPDQPEPIRCLFSATSDVKVFENYCKYLKLSNAAAVHFSSESTDDGNDSFFSFCTGKELIALLNPSEEQIKVVFKTLRESYIVPCNMDDKKRLNEYEIWRFSDRFASDSMIEYVDGQIKEQKEAFCFDYEKPLSYSSFLKVSIPAFLGYVASCSNDESERISFQAKEYTYVHEKASIFDAEFNTKELIGINNIRSIELAPNKFVNCFFSATEDKVLENYLSLAHFGKVVSYHFSSSPNGRVSYFSLCTGRDLAVLINPSQNQLNAVFDKIKNYFAVPCGLNDKTQLFFYDHQNKITKIVPDNEVRLIDEEIKQVQNSIYCKKFSYEIPLSYEKLLNIAYQTFLGYYVRSQFAETLCHPNEFTRFNSIDFIPLRKIDYQKTLALNWFDGKVYLLKKYSDMFKFNDARYLYKNNKMSCIIPFFGEICDDGNCLVFGFGSRGTLKDVAENEHLDIDTCKKITVQLAFLLAYLHMTDTKPCSISSNHVAVSWNYDAFLTDLDEYEKVINCTPEQLDVSNLGNVLYTLATGKSNSKASTSSIPSYYAPIDSLFELCNKPNTKACDLISEILDNQGFSNQKNLIDALHAELPQQYDEIEAFEGCNYKYFKIDCRNLNDSIMNFIKILKFGPITTFQVISDENINNRILIFESNRICGVLRNAGPIIVNIIISKMKKSTVAPVSEEDLSTLFEYYNFDLISNFIRDPQLAVYRRNSSYFLKDMKEFKDKFIVKDTLALSYAIENPNRIKIVSEEDVRPQAVQISFLNQGFNFHNEMPSNIVKRVEIYENYILNCLYSTEEDYTFNEFTKDFDEDEMVIVHFNTDENTNDEYSAFCTNNKLLLMKANNNEPQINKVIKEVKNSKVYGVCPDDRSLLFRFFNFDLIQSFANEEEMLDLKNKVDSANEILLSNEFTIDEPPMTYSTFFKHAGDAITGYYLLKNPNNNLFDQSVSRETENSITDASFNPTFTQTLSDFTDESDLKKAYELYLRAAAIDDPAALFNLGLMYSLGHYVKVDKSKAAEYYTRSADLGNPKAQFNLGLMYYKGEGVPENKSEAARLYQLAAYQGNSKAQSNLGFMYSHGEGVETDYEKAVEFYQKAIEQNDADAQLNLGLMYQLGQGVPVDKEKTVELYTKSAENGNPKAQFNLAVLYEKGEKGVLEKDIKKAIKYYSMAASKGLAKAQFNLGVLYSRGDEGLAPDKQMAAQYFQMAADQGDPDAQLNLGAMYSKGEGYLGVDKKKASELYKMSAEQGNPQAAFNLAVMRSKGDGIEKDYKEAVKYYEMASESGIPQAAFNLGVIYFRGAEGVPQDKKKAAESFERATVLNPKNAKAFFNLAVMYKKGEGVEQDDVKAREYYSKAAQLNNSDALLNLGIMYLEGSGGLQQDYKKAFECYQKAADLGNDKAQLNLGLMYLSGEGCTPDKEKAKEYFEKSSKQGNVQAQINLGNLLLKGNEDDREQAREYLLEAADQGNVDAILSLAIRNQQDDKMDEAIKWYSKASNRENAKSQLELGKIYLRGEGTDVDLNKSKLFLNKSLSNGSKEAYLYLGEISEKQGDTRKANDLYNLALEAGIEEARNKLNRKSIDELYSELDERIRSIDCVSDINKNDFAGTLNDVNDYLYNRGLDDCIDTLTKSNKELRLLEDDISSLIDKNPVSKSSNLPSLNKANSNSDGENSETSDFEDEELQRLKSNVKALEYQISQIDQRILASRKPSNKSSSADANSTIVDNSSFELPSIQKVSYKIQSPLNSTTSSGRLSTSSRSPRNKIKNLKSRAENGDANAQYLLGASYALGKDVEQDKEKAFNYYLLSANQGYMLAQFAVATCYSYGKGTEIDKAKAFDYYLLAAEQGHDKSQYAVGHFYDFGQGVNQDHDKAIEWYRKAAQQNHQTAIEILTNEGIDF